ncbi:hypothetical protein FOCC_FOCC017543 [Frankliniella occidentalis]|nr:hypothetical protein FOCC_FOCC017543 [Frankliniella occidentalis]
MEVTPANQSDVQKSSTSSQESQSSKVGHLRVTSGSPLVHLRVNVGSPPGRPHQLLRPDLNHGFICVVAQEVRVEGNSVVESSSSVQRSVQQSVTQRVMSSSVVKQSSFSSTSVSSSQQVTSEEMEMLE